MRQIKLPDELREKNQLILFNTTEFTTQVKRPASELEEKYITSVLRFKSQKFSWNHRASKNFECDKERETQKSQQIMLLLSKDIYT